jgi:hypothetical protein
MAVGDNFPFNTIEIIRAYGAKAKCDVVSNKTVFHSRIVCGEINSC